MKILSVSRSNLRSALDLVAEVLARGGVVAHPTETVWGLAADLRNPKAVRKIHAIKNTAPEKNLLVLIPKKSALPKLAHVSPLARALIREFWPGPLALILPARSGGTIGVRYSSHPLTRAIVRRFEKPLVTTSANLRGRAPARSAEEVREIFGRRKYQPDLVLDFAEKKKADTRPSTIVALTETEPRLVRAGPLAFKKILKLQKSRSLARAR